MTATAGYQTCVRVVHGIYCTGLCSSSTAVSFSPDLQTGSCVQYSWLISPGIFGEHIKLKVPPKIENMKHATTSDHDGGIILDLAGGCLRHLLPAVVGAVVPSVVAPRPIYR